MIRTIKTSYGAGYRAGMASPRIQRPGGTRDIKHIIPPLCPFNHPLQFIQRAAWHTGYLDGLMKRLQQPIVKGF